MRKSLLGLAINHIFWKSVKPEYYQDEPSGYYVFAHQLTVFRTTFNLLRKSGM